MKLNQRLEFILGMVDQITNPARKVEQAAQRMGAEVNATQKRIQSLDKQAAQLRGLSGMRREMVEHQKAAKAARERLKAMEKAVQEQGKASGITARQINEQRKAVEQANKAADQHRSKLNQVTRSLQEAGHNTNNLGASVQRVDGALRRENAELARNSRALTEATRRQEALTKAKEQHNKAVELAGKLAGAGVKTAAVGVGMVAGNYAAGSAYTEFDHRMSAVQATGGFDAAAKVRMAKQAREEAKASAWGATDAAAAQGFLAQAGFNEEAISKSLRGVMNLASATETGLAETADISSNILSGFGLDPDQMARVGDVLTTVTAAANTNLTELGGAMKYVAPVAKAAGYEIESVAAAAGLMSNAGIKDSQAGTALRAAVLRMASLPRAAKKAFDELGVETTDAEGNLRGLEHVLIDVSKSMEGMGSAEKLQKLSAMFGVEASAGLAELLDKSSGTEMLEFIKKLENAKGATDRATATRLANLKGDLQMLGSGVEELGLKYGDAMGGIYRSVIQAVTGIVSMIDGWMQRNPAIVKAIGIVVSVVGVLLAGLGALLIVLGGMLLAWAKVRLAMFMLPMVFRVVSANIRMMTAALSWNNVVLLLAKVRTTALTAALWAQNAALGALRIAYAATAVVARVAGVSMTLAFGLIGVAIAAVIALVAVLIQNWDYIKAFGAGVWDGFKQGVKPVLTILGELWAALGPIGTGLSYVGGKVAELWSWFTNLFNPVQATASGLKEAKDAGVSFGQALAVAFKVMTLPLLTVAEAVKWLVSSFGELWEAVTKDPSETFKAIWGGISDYLKLVFTEPGKAFNKMLDGVKAKVEAVKKWFGSIFGDASPEIKAAMEEAPAAAGSGTTNPKAPTVVKGNQVPPPKPVVNNTTTTTNHITINGTGLDQRQLQAAIEAAMAKKERADARKKNGGLYDVG